MALDRKTLLAKARQHRVDGVDKIKQIEFKLPTEAHSSNWGPLALVSTAEWLMVGAGVSDTLRAEFRAEATVDADYLHMLRTVDKWFTVVIRNKEYAPLDMDIMDYYTSINEAADAVELVQDVWDEDEAEAKALSIDASLDGFDASEAKQVRENEIAVKVDALMREKFGLQDDEHVVVRVIKKKP